MADWRHYKVAHCVIRWIDSGINEVEITRANAFSSDFFFFYYSQGRFVAFAFFFLTKCKLKRNNEVSSCGENIWTDEGVEASRN